MFKFQKYKLYLFSGRVVGGIEGGLIGVLFVSWIIPVIGQNGYALCDVLCTIAGGNSGRGLCFGFCYQVQYRPPVLAFVLYDFGNDSRCRVYAYPRDKPLGYPVYRVYWVLCLGTGFLLCSSGDDKQKDFWRFINKTEQLSPNHWNGFCDYRSKFFGSDRTFLGEYGGRNTVFCCSVFPVVLYADF